LGKLARTKRVRAQAAEHHISHCSKPQPQLIGAHCGGRGAVGEQIELALLDAVLHLATGAIDLLVEMAGLVLGARQRSDEKARVGAAAGPFGLRDNSPLAAPAVQGRPREVLEAARWPAGPF